MVIHNHTLGRTIRKYVIESLIGRLGIEPAKHMVTPGLLNEGFWDILEEAADSSGLIDIDQAANVAYMDFILRAKRPETGATAWVCIDARRQVCSADVANIKGAAECMQTISELEAFDGIPFDDVDKARELLRPTPRVEAFAVAVGYDIEGAGLQLARDLGVIIEIVDPPGI